MRFAFRICNWIRDWYSREQRLCIRVERFGIQLITGSKFHDHTQIHHRNTIADMPNHGKIVGDKEISQVELLLQLLQQIYHLRLDRNIQRRNRLITNNEGRLQSQSTCHANTLALTAGKLMWITAGKCWVQLHHFKQMLNTLLDLLARATS